MIIREQLRKILGDIKCVMEDFRENEVVFSETYVLLGYNNDTLKGLSLEFVIDEDYEEITDEQSYDSLRRLIKGCLADDIEISYVITNGGIDQYELQGSFDEVKGIDNKDYNIKFVVFIEQVRDPFSFDDRNYDLNVDAFLNGKKVYQFAEREYQEILEDLNNLLPDQDEEIKMEVGSKEEVAINEVEKFILKFRGDTGDRISDDKRDEVVNLTVNKYTNGYCYYFAKILQAAFRRGDVVILAPYSHLVWRDVDGKLYDINGEVNERDYEEFECQIEEEYLGDHLRNFLHRDGYTCNTTKEDIKQLIKEAKARNKNKSGQYVDTTVGLNWE